MISLFLAAGKEIGAPQRILYSEHSPSFLYNILYTISSKTKPSPKNVWALKFYKDSSLS